MITTRDAYLALAVTGQAVTSANSLPAGPFTLASWVQLRDASAANRAFFGGSVAGGPALRYNSGGRVIVFYVDGGSTIVATQAPGLEPFRWYHVAATWDGTTARIYIDGSLAASAAYATPFTSVPVRIGSDSAGNVFSGRIDDSVVWARALTADEIDAVWRLGPVAYPSNAFLDYRYDDVSATAIADLSGTANTGTLSATPGWSSGTYTQPKFLDRDMGMACTFNGTNQSIGLPASVTTALGGASGVTLLAWCRPVGAVPSSRRVINLLSDTGNAGGLIQVTPSGGNLFWESFGRSRGSDAVETVTTSGPEAPQPGRWTHVGLVLDFATPRYAFARDGVVVGRDTTLAWGNTSWLGSTQGGFVGSGPATNYWQGDLDEVLIYRRALSNAEIRLGYLTGQWDTADLVLRLDFDTGQLVDRSPFAHTLTLTNISDLDLRPSFL